MSETYQESQTRMIREARRAQERADRRAEGDRLQGRGNSQPLIPNPQPPIPRPLKACSDCYDLGVSAGIERERIRRWNDRIFCLLLGAFLGFVIAAMLTAIFWGELHT